MYGDVVQQVGRCAECTETMVGGRVASRDQQTGGVALKLACTRFGCGLQLCPGPVLATPR